MNFAIAEKFVHISILNSAVMKLKRFSNWLEKIEIVFHNGRLTSVRIVFRLNKTFFTHSDYNYVRITCFFVIQNRKLLIS